MESESVLEVEEENSIATSLERILKQLELANSCVKRLLKSTTLDQDDNELAEALRDVENNVVAINEALGMVANVKKLRDAKKQKKVVARRKRDRVREQEPEEVEEEVGEEEEEEVVERGVARDTEQQQDEGLKRQRKERKGLVIADGMAGRVAGDNLVYFSLNNLVCHREGSLIKCPTMNEGKEMIWTSLARKSIQQVEFLSLTEVESNWYLQQLCNDIISRFDINFNVLFESRGKEMIETRLTLEKDSSTASVNLLIESMATRVEERKLSATVSPSLSPANNAALMLSSAMHKNLYESNVAGWREEFVKQTKAMCLRCDLKFSTVERYRSVGALMLRSSVIACMLPSFVFRLELPISRLLANPRFSSQMESAFAQRMFGHADAKANKVLPKEKLIEQPFDDDDDVRDTGDSCFGSEVVLIEREMAVSTCNYGHLLSGRVLCAHGDCNTPWCPTCAGLDGCLTELVYPGTNSVISMFFYCSHHLHNNDSCLIPFRNHQSLAPTTEVQALTLERFVYEVQMEEANQIVALFSRSNCKFHIVPFSPDGWCIIKSISAALDIEFGVLINELCGFVGEFVKKNRSSFSKAEEFVRLWMSLNSDECGTAKALLACSDKNLVLPVIAAFLNRENSRAVQICVWSVVNGELERERNAYPNEFVVFQRRIDLLKVNVIKPHYVKLRRKA
jgi:hypothetical protein